MRLVAVAPSLQVGPVIAMFAAAAPFTWFSAPVAPDVIVPEFDHGRRADGAPATSRPAPRWSSSTRPGRCSCSDRRRALPSESKICADAEKVSLTAAPMSRFVTVPNRVVATGGRSTRAARRRCPAGRW